MRYLSCLVERNKLPIVRPVIIKYAMTMVESPDTVYKALSKQNQIDIPKEMIDADI